jgi:hypothetical protein
MKNIPVKGYTPFIVGILFIFFISFLAYFLYISKFGFYIDEWNLVYAGQVEGYKKFIDVYAIDRPFRAYLVGFMFQLFGLRANLYGYTSFFLRFIVSLGAFGLLFQLFPRYRWVSIFIVSLFAVYPGFLEQPIGFDFQTHHVALGLEIFSLVLMVTAWKSPKKSLQILFIVISVVFSFLCFLLMEIYIGLEGLRFILLIYLASEGKDIRILWKRPRKALRRAIIFWLPYLLSSLVFLTWRIAIFHSQRSSTDVPAIISKYFSNFIFSSVSFGFDLFRSYINVVLSGWIVPFYLRLESLRLRDSLIACSIGIFAGLVTFIIWTYLVRIKLLNEHTITNNTSNWLFWIGTIGVIFALAPSVFGDRAVDFASYSRFAYPAAIGAVLIIWSFIMKVQDIHFQGLLIAILLGISVTLHLANSIYYAQMWQSVNDFWWQTSWRIPQLKPETLIVANYSNAPITEDYNVRVPADLIYYPESYKPNGETRSPISSIVLTKDNIYAIQMGIILQDREKRGVVINQDLRNPLILSMPQEGSCVHVLDGKALELSRYENPSIQLVGKYSNIERIVIDSNFHTPPSALFGAEPEHGWCYFYEMASLARQKKDWQEIVKLGQEALNDDLHPLDKIEWFPFIQGFAVAGDEEQVLDIASRILDDHYLKAQGCAEYSRSDVVLSNDEAKGQNLLKGIFCD